MAALGRAGNAANPGDWYKGVMQGLSKAKMKWLASLADRKGRREERAFVAEGVRIVRDGLAAGAELRLLVAEADSMNAESQAGREIRALVASVNRDLVQVADKDSFQSLSDTVTSQGVLAAFTIPPLDGLERVLGVDGEAGIGPEVPGAVLVLDNLRDPGNVGTVLRNAAAFGCACVVLTEGCADPFSSKVVRASMGGVFSVPMSMGKKVEELVGMFREHSLPLYLLDSAPGVECMYPPPPEMRPVFVVGGETEGLSPGWRCGLERVIQIPQMPRIDSLNAGVASAVVLARWWEQVCPKV